MKEQGQKLIAAGATLVAVEPAMHMFGAGGPGVIVGLAAAAAAYMVAGDIHRMRNNGREETPAPVREKKNATDGKPSLAYRLVNGKSVREDGDVDTEGLPRIPTRARGFEDDELAAPRKKRTSTFLFSEVLEHFEPSLNKIYLGTLEDGRMIFCHAEDLCHVALAGTTRAGKTSIQRMLVAQLCYAGASVLILNPHYSRYILDKKEDWTPFEGEDEHGRPYLMYPPMECRDYGVIEHYLRQIADEMMPKRLDRFANGEPVGRPYFLVLDELPDIVKKVPGASGYLDDILRQGAKVNIFLICASQDFLVKTLRLEGGAVRECYRSAYYVGGDATTARTLLDMPANAIDESILGKGTVMLRNWQHVKQSSIASVPLMDNKALYALLGPSTYVAGQRQEENEDELVAYAMGAHEEAETEKMSAVRYTARNGFEAHQQRKTTHRQAAYVAREQGVQPHRQASPMDAPDDSPESGLMEDERRVLAAYRSGRKTGNAIAAITELPGTRVNKHLNKLSALGLIDWQPKA